MSLGLGFNLRLGPDVEVGRKIHKENLLLLRLPKHKQLLGLKTKLTKGVEEQIIGVIGGLHEGVGEGMMVVVETRVEVDLVKRNFNLVKQA